MAQSDVTSNAPPPTPGGDGPTPPRPRRTIPAFLVFGIVAATLEMAIVLALLYC